ncbi:MULTISPECIES: EAL domain-containing protein [Bradyrhizobium]|uniref:Diguanylate cyclase/phosphodiesterase with PAS/PAC sensor(S) n=2 Tax=Bradyrhizobium TaxID=374 RepID=A0ABY0PW34_9BRAD|nr:MULTISPECIES: EAL domain-containing protein [Bradyrhizobium]SDJ04632.1 diguanylate cyclase/phosphodiesterase with PAS/PAC sensor(s) [Bradyrhizobium ottawaense]SEC98484.1 diguanylate cyclase/phosphodiesterase with PAS/PAC sensor(s) [Bradyrhizobium lablabi]
MRADDCPAVETPEFLLAALEQASDAVVIVDSDRRVRHFNAAAERIWGFSRAEVLGRDADLFGLYDHQLRQIAAADQAASGRPVRKRDSEITIHHRDGRPIRVALSVSRVAIDGNVNTMAFVRDITVDIARRDKMALLNLVADKTNRGVVVTDRSLGIVYTNAAFAGLFGYSPEEVMGRQVGQLLAGPHSDRAALSRLRRRIGARDDGDEEILAYDRNGDEIWLSITVKAFRNERGRIKYIFGLLTDISETRQLRSLQQLIMGALADEVPITEISDRLCRRVEIIAPDVVSSVLHVDADGLIHPLGGPSLPAEYSRALDGVAIGPEIGSCGSAAYYGRAVLADNIDTDPRWQPFKAMPLAAGLKACWSTPIKAKDGRVIGTFAFYFRECRAPSRWHQRIVEACVHLGALAIERKEARAQIARLAYHDMLTGLPNRAQLRHLIDHAIKGCHDGQNVALLFLDLDHFKDVNDTLGHSAGDELLVELTRRLRARIQPGDMLGRLGGDEFVIVLPNGDPARASLIASEITEALTSPLRLGDRQVPISASMGISVYPDNATDIDTLMQQADAAMYKAKQAGRATYRFFSVDMNRLDEQRLIHIAALRNAIANDALKLHYQPQTRTVDGSIYGAEALARWHDPVLGEVPPLKFIRLAEECGLIEQIGMWSIREACRQLAAWRRAGLDVPCVSVNLSPINFQNRNLAAVVAENLATNGLPPEALMLEITESVLMKERSVAIETMNAIRELGVGLSLDDFGTGYSSLSRLAHLPIRELKIDRAFMRDIERDASALAVATAVVRVGQSLGMTVVAEGVETEAQRNVLKTLGCDVVQGYLFAPALPPEAFERWLLDHAVEQASTMLRRLSQSLPQPRETPLPGIAGKRSA